MKNSGHYEIYITIYMAFKTIEVFHLELFNLNVICFLKISIFLNILTNCVLKKTCTRSVWKYLLVTTGIM